MYRTAPAHYWSVVRVNKQIKQNNSNLQELQNQILENIISRPYDLSNEYSKKIKDLMNVFDKHQIPEKDSIALFEQILESYLYLYTHQK